MMARGSAAARPRTLPDLIVTVEGDATEAVARAFWTSFGALAAELLDDEDPRRDDHGDPREAA